MTKRPGNRQRPAMLRTVLAMIGVNLLIAAGCGSDGGAPGATTTSAPDDQSVPAIVAPSAGVQRAAATADPAAVQQLVAGINDAGFALLTDQGDQDNAVLSPASIGHALLMARAAADDQTGDAIDEAFDLPDGISAHEAWNSLDLAIDAGNGVAEAVDKTPTPVVQIADRIWPSTNAQPDQGWVDLLGAYHGADVQPIDINRPEVSRAIVNDWVADQTDDLIPELLPDGFIKPTTVLVLTDAVYFKAQWQSIFGKYGEVEGTFTRLDGTEVPATYMRHLELSGPRGRADGYDAAELAYLGGDYSMLVIVPDQGRFGEIRAGLSTAFVNDVVASIDPGPYELLLPQWQTTSQLDLLSWLTDMGAAPGAYPGISPGAFLGGAVHGADIAVDDIGTVAAAATALGFEESGPPEPEFTIAADRPYLYAIRHVESGLVLFTGQVLDLG